MNLDGFLMLDEAKKQLKEVENRMIELNKDENMFDEELIKEIESLQKDLRNF